MPLPLPRLSCGSWEAFSSATRLSGQWTLALFLFAKFDVHIMEETLLIPILQGAIPHPEHNWILSTRLVAEGYGVKPETVRSHKANHDDEILEGQHFIMEGNQTYWTQAGVIRLGMFIKSDQAIAFRNQAESYLVQAINQPVENFNTPSTLLEQLVEELADDILAQEIRQRLDNRLAQKRQERQTLVGVVGKMGLPIPQSWRHSA